MSGNNSSRLAHKDYGVAIICPLEIEMSAVRYMLDEEHEKLQTQKGDSNRYICGRMSGHNVVIGFLPQGSQGIGAAATVATDLKRSFPNAKIRLLVGIGGGVPSDANDVRLGDVVVSMPSRTHGGVLQYDLGKDTVLGLERKGFLEPPPTSWRTAVVEMQSDHRVKGNRITSNLAEMLDKYPRLMAYRRPARGKDVLFAPTSTHCSGQASCLGCDHTNATSRTAEIRDEPLIFYGTIASGNRVVKDAQVRAKISEDAGGVLCIEMEAAGLMNDFRCIVVRGISDYADSHKNDEWHAYAAAVAAGCAKELLSYVESSTSSSSHNQNVYWSITRSTNPYFTGRGDTISEITNEILDSLHDNTDQRRIVLTGMGGQGKSEIALHVANHVRSSTWGVFWVDVSTVTTAEADFREIGRLLNVTGQSIDNVRNCLCGSLSPWLLVLDNADDAEVDYQQYFPSGTGGTILLTSRNKESHIYATKIATHLDGLLTEDARTLLLKASRKPGGQDQLLDLVASDILSGHPLALIQAGAYIARGHCTIAEYPKVFEQQRQRLLSFRPPQARSRYGDVYATFEASIDILQSSPNTSSASQDALRLLSIISEFATSRLPVSFFRTAWEGARYILHDWLDGPTTEPVDDLMTLMLWHVSRLPAFIEANKKDSDIFRLVEAIHLLEAYSLINVEGCGDAMQVSMHPLAHAWARDRLDTKQRLDSWLTTACMVAVSDEVPYYWEKQQSFLRAHLQTMMLARPYAVIDIEPKAMIITTLVRCGQLLLRLESLKELADLVAYLFERLRLKDDVIDKEWYGVYRLASYCLSRTGSFQRAIRLSQRFLEYQKSVLGEQHPDTIQSLSDLVAVYETHEKWHGGLRLAEELFEAHGHLDEDNRARLSAQRTLAVFYRNVGRTSDALSLQAQVIKIQEQNLAKDDPGLLISKGELARQYFENGEIERAIAETEHSLEGLRRNLARDHPSVLGSQFQLAVMCRSSGETERAIRLLENVIEVQKNSAGQVDLSFTSLIDPARYLVPEEERAKMMPLMAHVSSIKIKMLAPEQILAIRSQEMLIGLYQQNGQLEKAISLIENLLELRTKTLGQDDSLTMGIQKTLACLFWENKQLDKAIALTEKLIELEMKESGPDHPSVTQLQQALSLMYSKNGQLEEAIFWQKKSIVCKERISHLNDELLQDQCMLSLLLWRADRWEEALDLGRKVVEDSEQVLDEDHPFRRRAEQWLERMEDKMQNASEGDLSSEPESVIEDEAQDDGEAHLSSAPEGVVVDDDKHLEPDNPSSEQELTSAQ